VTGTLSSTRVCCKDDKLASFKHMYMRNWATGQILQVANDCPGMQAASSSYEQYLSLASQHLGHSTHQDSSELLCDRCLQPIDEATFQANVWRLEASPTASQQCTACIAQQHSMHSTACTAQQHSTHATAMAPIGLPCHCWQVCGSCTMAMGPSCSSQKLSFINMLACKLLLHVT